VVAVLAVDANVVVPVVVTDVLAVGATVVLAMNTHRHSYFSAVITSVNEIL